MPRLLYPDLCPDCGYTLSRSRRRGWFEKLVARLVKVRVFRCHRCGARFYSPPAVIVHAPKADSHHVQKLESVREADAPLSVVAPEIENPVRQVVVKVSPGSEKTWPSGGNDSLRQGIQYSSTGVPFLSAERKNHSH